MAPLGVRFFDPVIGKHVSDLVVSARPTAHPRARALAMSPNRSGVFVLYSTPGLADFLSGSGDTAFWAAMPTPVHYTLIVADPQQRYLPFSFRVDVPTRGLYTWSCPLRSPIEADPTAGVPLFSTPQRPPPEGMAVLRADLYDPVADRPAAWAVVEVHYEDRMLGRGIADARGQVAVFFPNPPPLDFLPSSPPAAPLAPGTLSPPAAGSLWEQAWTVNIRVGWVPPRAPSPPDAQVQPAEAPDLCASLSQLEEPPAFVWADAAQTRLLTEASLKFGQDLVLRSAHVSPPDAGSPARLLITPAATPF